MRMPAAVLALVLVVAVRAVAQDSLATVAPKRLCFHNKPKPACAAFLLTNFGLSFVVGVASSSSETPLRGTVDWGYMSNVSTHDAVGASAFASLDEAGFAVGPSVRYRRWLTRRASLDIAVGTPVLSTDNDGDLARGSILAAVRWSPVSWFAVTARPELLQRWYSDTICCERGTTSKGRLSIGIEAGEVPGLVAAGAAGVVLLVGYLIWEPQP